MRLPAPGQVKTRLAATMGAETAAAAYRLMVETLLSRITPTQQLRLLYTPPAPETEVPLRDWLATHQPRAPLSFRPQAEGGLGERLTRAFAEAFADGYERVAVIGTDCLGVDAALLENTWTCLDQPETDVVLGPATDGGYYLLAAKTPSPTLFAEIPWSTDAVLATTLERAAAAGLRTHLLPELSDIDTEADWLAAAAAHELPPSPEWRPLP